MYVFVFLFCAVVSPVSLQDASSILTKRGCTCSTNWTMGDQTYNGCGNPDKDPNGDWCIVDPKTCTLASAGRLVEGGSFQGRYFDYCIEQQECDVKSFGGCECLKSWPYKNQLLSGCVNPDDDPRGSWCFVDNSTCTGKATGPIRNSAGSLLGVFDYCTQTCPSPVVSPTSATLTPTPAPAPVLPVIDIPQITVSVAVGPPKDFKVCTTTSGGCACQQQWTYDGNRDGTKRAYYGCARTSSDSIGPWCPITNVTSCIKDDPHTVKSGATDAEPWDYCDTDCIPPTSGSCSSTVNGCKCQNVWEYDGIQQKGCTQPDADAAYSWCVINLATCSKPSGKLPNSNLWWDRCAASCQ
eukprot:TRINITY_DN3281_c0_g1_i2.p1 TRINITY_DN3281_c0_g1~~TRINITY_DN3281_c0_g1_i2.p1  ORF type:complete len:353 (-),score=37.40 TRINITY_DN3281_c0_g1_i2:263-1321(-)